MVDLPTYYYIAWAITSSMNLILQIPGKVKKENPNGVYYSQ